MGRKNCTVNSCNKSRMLEVKLRLTDRDMKQKTETLIISTQEQPIRTNLIKAKINKTM